MPAAAPTAGALVAHLEAHEDALSEESRQRLRRNPLRVLDSKDEGDRAVLADAPAIDAHLSPEAAAFFDTVCDGLGGLGIAFTRNPRLVRGLDYYCHTAFEFTTEALGAQGAVLAGGRYDGLVETMGGPPTPGVGWAGGIERLAALVGEVAGEVAAAPRPIAIVPLGSACRGRCARARAAPSARGLRGGVDLSRLAVKAAEAGRSGAVPRRRSSWVTTSWIAAWRRSATSTAALRSKRRRPQLGAHLARYAPGR